MFKRHVHRWEEVSRTFTPPPQGHFQAKGLTGEELESTLYGFTVIELRYTECGDLKHVRVVGDVPAPEGDDE